MIQPVSHYTSCKYIARTFSCAEPGSATIPSLLLTHHTTVSSTNESNLPRSIWGEGEKDFSQGSKKNYKRNKPAKDNPKAALAHTHICSMTSFRYTPSTSATYSSRLVPFPPASGPNVFTWNRTSSSTVTPTPPRSLPQGSSPQTMSKKKPGTCEGKMNAYPGDKRARHELLQKGCEDLVLHFTKKWLTSMQLL